MTNDWNQKWKSVGFIGFKDVQEIVVFEEAHCPVGDLKVEA